MVCCVAVMFEATVFWTGKVKCKRAGSRLGEYCYAVLDTAANAIPKSEEDMVLSQNQVWFLGGFDRKNWKMPSHLWVECRVFVLL